MFNVLAGEKKRRVLSPATVVASVAAHVLLVGGVMFASSGPDTPPAPHDEPAIKWTELPPEPPRIVEPAPPPPPVETPAPDDAIPPTTGENVVLHPPVEPPPFIPPVNPNQTAITPDMMPGTGADADVIGPPMGPDVPVTGNHNPPAARPLEDMVVSVDMVEERPVLDRGGLGRALERNYPTLLRDAGVSGRVVLEVVVDESGRVRPNSARVIEASHPQFGEASIRAAERFRFRPAKIGGVAVPVRVTVPIVWSLAN
ncbi:MAG TPA: TonB family protein [Longimicrobium sp.]|jgi:TonB family protein|uniref:energy transducer TonB n=1 Tax=Longimicrobium sp. TaxID=2029185 RepID=UPI002EDAF14F